MTTKVQLSLQIFRLSLVALLLLPLSACGERAAPQARRDLTPKNLTIYGYNYTDLGMYSFAVDGQWGGDLAVSNGAAGGGGSSVCCVTHYPGIALPEKVKIKWTRGDGRNIWCEQEVLLHGPIPPKPRYFEVHFYQDGHIELAVTENRSPPRLTLERVHPDRRKVSGNTINDEKFSRCKHDN